MAGQFCGIFVCAIMAQTKNKHYWQKVELFYLHLLIYVSFKIYENNFNKTNRFGHIVSTFKNGIRRILLPDSRVHGTLKGFSFLLCRLCINSLVFYTDTGI